MNNKKPTSPDSKHTSLGLLATGGVDPDDAYERVSALQRMVTDTLFREYKVRVLPRQFEPRECITPRYIRFPLDLAVGERLKSLTDRNEEIAILAGKSHCDIYTDEQGVIWCAFPRKKASTVNAYEYLVAMPPKPRGYAALGLDTKGQPIALDLLGSSEHPHLLTTGTSGAGKTVNQKVMLASMAYWTRPSYVNFIILDVKGGESFSVFGDASADERLIHMMHPVVYDPGEMRRVLWWVVKEIERRQRERMTLPHIVVITDELADVIRVAGQDAHDACKVILDRGRSANVHLMVATSRPDKDSIGKLGGLLKFRISFSTVRASDAFLTTNQSGSGAHHLGMGGDMLIGERGVRAQGFMISDHDVRKLLAPHFHATRRELTFEPVRVPDPPTPGRPVAEPKDEELELLRAYYAQHARWPTPSALSRGLLGKGMGVSRAHRLLDKARGKPGKDEPDD